MRRLFIPVVLVILASVSTVSAAQPWPAESNTVATKLTAIDEDLDKVNWSGASWNPETRSLWLACNSGYFWELVEDGTGGFKVATNTTDTQAKWSPAGGDLESICQADYTQRIVYVMDEKGWIREYDVSQFGVVVQNRSWDIRAQCPESSGSGPEGITFVPDVWLQRQGFRASNGNLYTSTNGMGGLMFVGHQSGGYVHVFDLNRVSNSYSYVGKYKTGQSETAGLEFDRSTGKLYIWHNVGSNNFLEVVKLSSYVDDSERRLRQIIEYEGPRTGNLEGFALVPTPETNNWCFITDDSNDNGEAVVWYSRFQPSERTVNNCLPHVWILLH